MGAPPYIPITVFTGFLGAGKTSIILSLLPRLPEGYKVVLLKNEYGDVEGEADRISIFQSLPHARLGPKNSHLAYDDR